MNIIYLILGILSSRFGFLYISISTSNILPYHEVSSISKSQATTGLS